MSRKKGGRREGRKRKVKVTDSYSRPSPNSNTMDLGQKSSQKSSPHGDNLHSKQDHPVNSGSSLRSLMPVHWNKHNHPGKTSSSAVKVKTEPNESGRQMCTNEKDTQQRDVSTSDSTSTFRPAKIKRERLSLDSSVLSSRSTHQFPTMDLGSHLEQSLSSLKSGPDLTWSQLMDSKNLPKVHIPERLQSEDFNKTRKPDSGSEMDVCSPDNITESQSLDNGADKSSTLDAAAVAGKDKVSGTGLSGSGTGLTGSRFSKNHDGGSSILDLSKKAIPLEIRRVLASKYGVVKRHDDGHAGNFVPNLNKSRSRFTHSLKKAGATDSEDESNNRVEISKSGQLLPGGMDTIQESEVQHTQAPTGSSQELQQSSTMAKSKSVSPTECPSVIPLPAKMLNRRRFSSSMYERSSGDRRERVTDKLQSHGLVDLGSHYGSLLKDSPPPLAARNSGSPYEESVALDRDKEDSSHALNAETTTRVAKGLLQGVRRSSFSGTSSPNFGSRNLKTDTLHRGDSQKSNQRSLQVSGRNSKSPVDFESRKTGEATVDLGSKGRFGHHEDSLHSSARSSSRSPLGGLVPNDSGPMIDLNTSTSQLTERTAQQRRRSPFGSSHEAPSRATDTSKEMVDRQNENHHDDNRAQGPNESSTCSLPRTSSRSPVRMERSTPPNIKGPMIELSGGKQFQDYLESAKNVIPRSSSRSPVRTDTRSPNEPMVKLGNGKQTHESNTKHGASRSQSRSPLLSDLSSKCGSVEGMIELRSGDRLSEQRRSRSRSPDPRATSEAMIDLGSTSHLHERRGAPRMKPLEGMIDLNSKDNPASPLSPGFGVLPFSSFPSQVYRHPNRQRFSYKSKHYLSRPQRGTSPALNSPGFSPRLPFAPRFNYPPNPRLRIPSSAMIELGNHGKSSELLAGASSRSSEIPLRPVPPGSIPKRRHSMDSPSLSEPVKKPRVAVALQKQDVKPKQDVRLNVNDLLELEREEQKYIQNLSLVQSQLTEVRFKMQRMQQDLERLQSSEMDIKRRIDVVRARRVKILKDAQDNQESRGISGALGDDDMNTRRSNEGSTNTKRMDNGEDVGTARGDEDDVVKERDNECDKGTPVGNQGSGEAYNRGSLEFRSSPEEKKSERHGEVNTSSYGGSREYRNLSNDRNLAPSELVLRDMNNAHHPRPSTNAPIVQQYPIASSSNERSYHNILKPTSRRGNWESSSLVTSQEKHSAEIETFESSDGSTITLNRDGTMVLRKNKHEASQHAKKRVIPTILEEACEPFDGEQRHCGGVVSGESQQFLGCLEISSTTDEPLTNHDDGPKEVLAEKERECLASKLRCDQDRISSTVPSLEIEQDDDSVGSAPEMDFVGHTDAVCYILPYKGKLFSASADRTVKAFDLKTGKCIKTFQGHELAVNCLQIFADRLFTGANDQSVRAYNIKSGACTHKFSFRGRVMCLHAAFGKLFVGLSSGFVAVIDLQTNECIDQFNCHEPSRISCLASATEGHRSLLCTGSFDSTITIRDQSTGLLLRQIKDHKLTVLCMHVVENILYSGSADTVVQSHNINTGELVRSYTGHTMSVSGLQALGGVLVTSSLDRIIRCFDIKTGDLLQLYGGNTDMIFSLSVIGDMIYTGCRDGRVSGVKLDLRKYHCCKWGDCSLKFGLLNHLKQHVQDHINQIVDFKSCFWDECVHKFPRGKQLDVIQAATEHIMSHVPNTKE